MRKNVTTVSKLGGLGQGWGEKGGRERERERERERGKREGGGGERERERERESEGEREGGRKEIRKEYHTNKREVMMAAAPIT